MVLVTAAALGAAACTAAPIDIARLAPGGLGSGIVAHWSFDDGAGATLRDDTGNGHDGTVAGATWTAGQFQGALSFQAGQEVTVPSFPPATASWTVSAWVRVAADQPGGTDYVTLVSTEVPFAGGWELQVVPTAGAQRFHFGYWVGPGDSDYDYLECACVTDDAWTHLAAVVDGDARTLTLYVNGAPAGSVGTRHDIRAGSPTLYMAAWSESQTAGDPTRFFSGALDDVAVWGRALVASEVSLLLASPAPDR
jgi:hypothetical protein